MLTYYRTSRSLHFPLAFGHYICSLSGAQPAGGGPEIWSVSWKPPLERAHRIASGCRLFQVVASPHSGRWTTLRPRSSQAEARGVGVTRRARPRARLVGPGPTQARRTWPGQLGPTRMRAIVRPLELEFTLAGWLSGRPVCTGSVHCTHWQPASHGEPKSRSTVTSHGIGPLPRLSGHHWPVPA